MGVLGSFRKEVMVKELKNLCFTDEKCLDKVIHSGLSEDSGLREY